MFHLPPSEGHCQFHPNSINEFSKCFIVSLFQTVMTKAKNNQKFITANVMPFRKKSYLCNRKETSFQ